VHRMGRLRTGREGMEGRGGREGAESARFGMRRMFDSRNRFGDDGGSDARSGVGQWLVEMAMAMATSSMMMKEMVHDDDDDDDAHVGAEDEN